MPDIDPNLYDPDPLAPDAKERTAALLQLLQQQRTGAMLGAAGGGLNGLLPALGKVMGAQAQTQQGQVQGAPAARLSLIMDKLKQAKEQQDVMQEGPQAALGGMAPKVATAAAHLLTGQAAQTKAQQENWEHLVNPNTGEAWLIDKRSGQAKRLGGQPAAGPDGKPMPVPMGGKLLDKKLKELGADFDPSGGRAGEFGKNQARVNAAGRVLALATDQNGNAVDLTPNQMPELAQSIASLISAGGQGAQSQIEHLTPKTLRGDMQRTLQWLTGNPRGADQVAFVQNMIETAKRERTQAQEGIDQVRTQRANKHQMVLTSNPEESRKVLQGFGWDLGPDGMPIMKGAIAPTEKPDTSALRKKYGL